jgi:hypothetical protein
VLGAVAGSGGSFEVLVSVGLAVDDPSGARGGGGRAAQV